MIVTNKFNSITWLILLLLYCRINYSNGQNEDEWILLTRPRQNRNTPLSQTSETDGTVLSSVTSMYDDVNDKLENIYTSDPYLYENNEGNEGSRLKFFNEMSTQQSNRSMDNVQCLWCFADRGFMSDESCYTGKVETKVVCSDAEICYTELHPQYIKRGCFLPNKVNRTFVCNCPLCNDKPAHNPIYYQYKKIADWDYHNKRVQIPIVGVQLICKVCDTRGLNKIADDNCKLGKNTDYTICKKNQVCYINIDEVTNFVSRGCIDTPAYNSMFYFCNNSLCNTKPFYVPSIRPEKLLLNNYLTRPQYVKDSGLILTTQIYLKFFIIFQGVLFINI